MIRIYEQFLSEAQARTFMERTYNNYHPCGYGTTLRYRRLHDGTHEVSGHRFSSCD